MEHFRSWLQMAQEEYNVILNLELVANVTKFINPSQFFLNLFIQSWVGPCLDEQIQETLIIRTF